LTDGRRIRARIVSLEGKLLVDLSKYTSPSVPNDLIQYTCGNVTFEEFLLSGFEVKTMLDMAARHCFGKNVADFDRVLDFGCGCGRILRFQDNVTKFSACDVNELLISYVEKNFPIIDTYQNNLSPPLKWKDGIFDLIYSFSVFSHLSKDVEESWLHELVRVGSDRRCVYLITIQGDWMISHLPEDMRNTVKASGFYWSKVHDRHGSKLDFPIYYESSYHTSDYIKSNWSKYFEILDVIKGDNAERYLRGTTNGGFRPRPMGQDLVVALKK
jgi:SAM-dependent methyltransferase